MIEDLLEVFDSWTEVIQKARKPKGLDNWKKLESIAGKLTGKQARDITFTCSHPSHEGEAVTHVLGSTTGNLHFLQGYGNPAFHLADYHWQVIDPNIDESSIKDFNHPSRPELWAKSGLPMEDEGDQSEGKPHPDSAVKREEIKKEKDLAAESVRASNNYAEYLGIPSLGLVYGLHNNHMYKWDIVKNSFFSAMNPEFYEAMEPIEEEEIQEPVEETTSKSFDINEVYSLVCKRFPKPGSVVKLKDDVIGKITKSSIDFYDNDNNAVGIVIYDTIVKSIDLRRDGDTSPNILLNFAKNYLNIDVNFTGKELPYVSTGTPTELENLDTREVIQTSNGWRRK